MSLIPVTGGMYINPDNIERVVLPKHNSMYVKIYWHNGGYSEIEIEQFNLLLSRMNKPEPTQLTKDERYIVGKALELFDSKFFAEQNEQSELAYSLRSIKTKLNL